MKKSIFLLALSGSLFWFEGIGAADESVNGEIQPMVVPQIFEAAKKNTYWKRAFATGKEEQIVFMNVSPSTNPKNEIGVETHPFDQVILIVEGKGKAFLNDQTSTVKAGDLLFIPMGTPHNVINLDSKKGLKLISFYSNNDIPPGSEYETKADETEE